MAGTARGRLFCCDVCLCVRARARVRLNSFISLTGLTCHCSGLYCLESSHTRCNVSDGGYCIVKQHIYQGNTKFEYMCVEAPNPISSLGATNFLLCHRSLGHCIVDVENELGCFCCRTDECNTRWFYYEEQRSLFGLQSSSVPLPTPEPTSKPTRAPSPGTALVRHCVNIGTLGRVGCVSDEAGGGQV